MAVTFIVFEVSLNEGYSLALEGDFNAVGAQEVDKSIQRYFRILLFNFKDWRQMFYSSA